MNRCVVYGRRSVQHAMFCPYFYYLILMFVTAVCILFLFKRNGRRVNVFTTELVFFPHRHKPCMRNPSGRWFRKNFDATSWQSLSSRSLFVFGIASLKAYKKRMSNKNIILHGTDWVNFILEDLKLVQLRWEALCMCCYSHKLRSACMTNHLLFAGCYILFCRFLYSLRTWLLDGFFGLKGHRHAIWQLYKKLEGVSASIEFQN